MKRLVFIFAALCSSLLADGLPSALEYKSGMKISDYTITKWKKDSIVIKYRGGIAPVHFRNLVPEQRELFEAAAKVVLLNEKERLKKEAEQRALQQKFEKAIREGDVMVGMTSAQVIRSWGKPNKINRAYGKTDQWIYRRAKTFYFYFEEDKLISWQSSG